MVLILIIILILKQNNNNKYIQKITINNYSKSTIIIKNKTNIRIKLTSKVTIKK